MYINNGITLGSIERIIIKWNISEVNIPVIVQLRLIFSKTEEKIYSLILDYLHLLNGKVCNKKIDCTICKLIKNEFLDEDINEKRYSLTLGTSSKYFLNNYKEYKLGDNIKLIWDIKSEEIHCKSIGILSRSTFSSFIFPSSIFKLSNVKYMILILNATNGHNIWNSEQFTIDQLSKVNDIDKLNNNIEDYIYNNKYKVLVTTSNKSIYYLSLNDSNINDNNLNGNNEKILDKRKFSSKILIEKSLKLHKILKSYRNELINIRENKEKFNKKLDNFVDNLDNMTLIKHDHNKKISKKSTNDNNFSKDTNIEEYQENSSYPTIYKPILFSPLIHDEILSNIKELEEVWKMKIMECTKLRRFISLHIKSFINILYNQIYPIKVQYKTGWLMIRDVPLPPINVLNNLDTKEQPGISIGLGYCLHYLDILCKIFQLSLPIKLKIQCSFCFVDNYPLYCHPDIMKMDFIQALNILKKVFTNDIVNALLDDSNTYFNTQLLDKNYNLFIFILKIISLIKLRDN
ncbi:uncharacterized protein CMU_027640 [Cryptosporidium muris RN66]|uniref:Uncharacterized protein n=1 Tax=Cryptosporidium muris (strain RN66) TaxID=441375 RepID=B6ABK2_CRYMR|nr:uncharacterized protein CMU_027640 [Cryptosporidium muris RN66]EEA05754.1 hypothetical protein, conserved [Cryptosporidium muris RN66]|eukprot:XP_002140103.1 hypothetical protein [Cryptosporidium muris RN66]